MFFSRKKSEMPTADTALKGRASLSRRPSPLPQPARPLKGPYPEGLETAIFGLGCFWGAERKFWEMGEGIWVTAVGYAGGVDAQSHLRGGVLGPHRPQRGGAGRVRPQEVSYETLLKTFWESHDPTQGMRQGNDVGTQYRSGIYVTSAAQRQAAEASKAAYQKVLSRQRLRSDHHRDRRRARVLLRRGLSPAVSGQGAARLLRPGRNGPELPGRHGSQGRRLAVGPAPRQRPLGCTWGN